MIKRATVFAIAGLASAAAVLPAEDRLADPFATLREGYERAAPDRAAEAYHPDARYIELYPGTPPVVRRGRAAIRAGFDALFRDLELGPNRRADLNFRLDANGIAGFYRLRVPGSPDGYGKFVVEITDGRFAFDVSGPASRDEFEDAPGPVRFADGEETLDPEYYDRPVGRYARSAGDRCGIVLTRSIRRYFLFDECAGSWRGLNRLAGQSWTAGDRVLDPAGQTPVVFDPERRKLTLDGKSYARDDGVRRTAVTFRSDVILAGTLYRPAAEPSQHPAVVLIHGSGPQDRNGYASLMALYAEHLARRGFVVLSFDKRGTGQSRGDLPSAGFDQLGGDVRAALAFLRAQPGVDKARVGVMGSSQAGWVAASAIRHGADPAFAILVGAAGSALTVAKQNLYNTEIRMRCARISEPDIALALAQQRAFFMAKADPARIPALQAATTRTTGRSAITDWLFPATVERSSPPQWYDVLDPEFDPLPVWRAYKGRAFFVFGESDDSTPASVAVARLRSVPRATVALISDAQHIGLETRQLCAGDLDATARFHPLFLATLEGWLDEIIASPVLKSTWLD